jgi:integrase
MKHPPKHLTERLIQAHGAPAKGSDIVHDTEVRGLGLRTTAAGVKAYIFEYSLVEPCKACNGATGNGPCPFCKGRGRRSYEHQVTVGRVDELSLDSARDKATEFRALVREGRDPMLERKAEQQAMMAAPTMSDLCERYMREWAPRKRSVDADRRMIEGEIKPHLGTKRVAAVTKSDIDGLHQRLRGTPFRANRVLALLRKMFSLAMEWGMRTNNPASGIEQFFEHKREIMLDTDQRARLQSVLESYPDRNVADQLMLMALTGSREGEARLAEWTHFDLEHGIWNKPQETVKQGAGTGEGEHLTLSDEALALIKRMAAERTGTSRYLFPGKSPDKPRHRIEWHWRKIATSAGLATPTGKLLPPYVLRHGFAGYLAEQGVPLHDIGKLMGHRHPATTQRYAYLSNASMRRVANLAAGAWNGKEQKPASR